MNVKSPKLWLVILLLIAAVWVIGNESLMSGHRVPVSDADNPFALLPADKQISVPDFSLKTPEGDTVKLSKAVADGPVVLDFWATYCGPCRMELPDLDSIRKDYESKGIHFYAVNANDDATTVRQFATQTNLGIPMLLDNPPYLSQFLQINAIPVTIVIDKRMKIVVALAGYDPNMKNDLPGALDQVLDRNI